MAWTGDFLLTVFLYFEVFQQWSEVVDQRRLLLYRIISFKSYDS